MPTAKNDVFFSATSYKFFWQASLFIFGRSYFVRALDLMTCKTVYAKESSYPSGPWTFKLYLSLDLCKNYYSNLYFTTVFHCNTFDIEICTMKNKWNNWGISVDHWEDLRLSFLIISDILYDIGYFWPIAWRRWKFMKSDWFWLNRAP